MNSDYIKLIKANCKNCHKCIRSCPVKSINFHDGQANIMADDCILCGQCFITCPQNAKQIRTDRHTVKQCILEDKRVIASIAPSFAANYKGATIATMREALKELGFSGAEETAVGAHVVKTRYEELISELNEERKNAGTVEDIPPELDTRPSYERLLAKEMAEKKNVVISSCCPVINDFITDYRPEMLKYLADVVTPAEIHARMIKQQYPDAVTVFIGPCIAKKKESDKSSAIDYALTFDELTRWLGEEVVMLKPQEDHNENSRSRIFPTSHGVLRSMERDPEWTYLCVDGMASCRRAIDEIAKGELDNCFIEMSACKGSCVCGPAMEKRRTLELASNAILADYAGKDDFIVEQPKGGELKAGFAPTKKRSVIVSDTEIERTLRLIGKNSPEKELNCGFCGYDTCRDKAAAVCEGKAEIDMCLPFLMEKAQSFSDIIVKYSTSGIIVLNETMEIQSLNDAACEIMNISNKNDVWGEQLVTILDPRPVFAVVQQGKQVRNVPTYLAEYGKYVEQTVIYNREYHVIIITLRDITDSEIARKQKESSSMNTVEVADRVIEHQMRVVQEIASLLGQTAAETKIALTKLKESLTNNE